MALIGLSEIRQLLDEAITYAEIPLAQSLAEEGLRAAEERKMPGEAMYFSAQKEIIAENFPAAIALLDQAIEHNPKDGAAYNDRALCMLEMGIIDDALPYFDKGIEVEPDYASVYHNKGWLLNKLGQPEKAISLFQKALALEPNRAVTYENMADAFISLGRIDEAICAYQTSLNLLKDSHGEIKKQIEMHLKKAEGLR